MKRVAIAILVLCCSALGQSTWAGTTVAGTSISTATPPISVSISPTSAAVPVTLTQQFTATVTNSGAGVTWSVVGAGCGSVNGTGLWTAPATKNLSCSVKATAVADGTKSASATVTAGNLYADLNGNIQGATGIDSDAAQTIGPGIVTGSQLLGTNFYINTGHANDTIDVVADGGPGESCANLNTGHKSLVFKHASADGGEAFGTYLWLQPTGTGNLWQYNPFADNTIYWSYKTCISATAKTYLANTSAQIKSFLTRTASSGYQSNNGNGSPGYGVNMDGPPSAGFCTNAYRIQDDPNTGVTYRSNCASGPDGTAAVTVNCVGKRTTSTHLFNIICQMNGTEYINTVTGNCGQGTGCAGGIANMNMDASDATHTVGFHIGIRYFAVCTNACVNATIDEQFSGIKVGDWDFNQTGMTLP